MSSNNNLLLLIIAGVIALIVLHITTSNQNCSIPEKKSRKERKAVSVVSTPPTPPVITGANGGFSNERLMSNTFNGASSQSRADTPVLSLSGSTLPPPSAGVSSNSVSSSQPSSSSSSSVSSVVSSPAPPVKKPGEPFTNMNAASSKFSENFSYTEQSQVTEGFTNNINAMDTISESNQIEGYSESNQIENFGANDAKSMSEASTGANPKPDFVIKSASLGNKFGGGNFNTKLTGSSGAVGPNTTNVNGLGVVEGAPDYTLGVTPVISKEKKAKKLTAKDLLPKASKDDWFDMPYDNKQMMRIENENLLAGTATQARIGIDTQGQTLKNASHDLRAAPPNPKFNVGPWFISTIEPDYNIKPIM
jgi:hypothetical protein